MASVRDYCTEGPRIVYSSLRNRLIKKKYEGDEVEICRQIVKDCWNGRYFQTSTRNFAQFWSRDFGWCCQSLLKLQYEKEVHHSLRYALNRFFKYRKITTTITPLGRPYDFPVPAVDSLPWLIHSIRISKFHYLSFQGFLNREIEKFFQQFIDPQTGMVKPELHTSSIKDFAIRRSSCYDNCLVGMLAGDLKSMKLNNPFQKYDYPSLIKRHFWSGNFFYDDLKKINYIAGDANIFPFLTGMCKDKEMLVSALRSIQQAGLDTPFPLKYTSSRENIQFTFWEMLFRNYESSSIWTHMGPLFIRLVAQVDKQKAREYLDKYGGLIEQHKNYLEVFDKNRSPFRSLAYYCDSGMLWAANYLTLTI